MRLLNGKELAEYIEERQAKEVRRLVQSLHTTPKLRILQNIDDPVIDTYVRLKKAYGEILGIEVEVQKHDGPLDSAIEQANQDKSVHGIIVQLPLANMAEVDKVLNLVSPDKDVDGLGDEAKFDSATATAILWLLAGYNIDLAGKRIVVIGKGKLVGAPLARMLASSGFDVVTADRDTEDLERTVRGAEILISGTGVPGLIQESWVRENAVVVDAGTASESGKIVGDIDPELYAREHITITPQKGGVGPLTVCSLFDNVLRSARNSVVL